MLVLWPRKPRLTSNFFVEEEKEKELDLTVDDVGYIGTNCSEEEDTGSILTALACIKKKRYY